MESGIESNNTSKKKKDFDSKPVLIISSLFFSFFSFFLSQFYVDGISMVYSTYTEAVGTRTIRPSGKFSDMRNGKVRLRMWNARGDSPSFVKVNDNILSASVLVIPYVF